MTLLLLSPLKPVLFVHSLHETVCVFSLCLSFSPLFAVFDEFTPRRSCPYLQFRTFLICRMAPIRRNSWRSWFISHVCRHGSYLKLTKDHSIWTFLFSLIFPRSQPNNVSNCVSRGPPIVCEQTMEDSAMRFTVAFQNDRRFGSASTFLFQCQSEV